MTTFRVRLLLLGTIALLCSACGILVVQPGEVAVVYNVFSGELMTPFEPGSHFLGPFEAIIRYSTLQQEYTMSGDVTLVDGAVESRTTDGQIVSLEVTIIYSIDPDFINMIHFRWGDQYHANFIRPTARSIVREVVAQFRADDIYGMNRVDMMTLMADTLRQRLAEEGFNLRDLLVRNVTFTPQFVGTMEAQMIAAQQAMLTQTAAAPAP